MGAVYDANHPSCASLLYDKMPTFTHFGALRRLSRFSPSSPSSTRTASSSSSSSPYSIVIVNNEDSKNNTNNNITKRSVQQRNSVSFLTKFDDNHQDYDIFLRLAHDVGLPQSLHDFEHQRRSPGSSGLSTLFVPRDLAVIQTALDIESYLARLHRRQRRRQTVNTTHQNQSKNKGKHSPSSSSSSSKNKTPHGRGNTKHSSSSEREIMSEYEAYQTIISFTRRFRYPRTVLTAIIRNHVTPAKLSLCDFIFALYWKTWAGTRVNRFGLTLETDTHVKDFIPAQLVLNILLPIRTRQGVIQQIDRMLIPDLSGFMLKLSPSPSPSPLSSPSVDTAANRRKKKGDDNQKLKNMKASPSVSPLPLPSSSPSQSAEPSTKPIPDIPEPVVFPIPSHNRPGPTGTHSDVDMGVGVVGPDTITGSQPQRTNCFPASASVRLCNGQRVVMRDLQIGDCVVTSASTSLAEEENTSVSRNAMLLEKSSRKRIRRGMSHVFMFSHRMETRYRMPFIRIATTGGQAISLSSEHYLPIVVSPLNHHYHYNNNTQQQQQPRITHYETQKTTTLVIAESVTPGMWVDTIDGIHQVTDVRIVYDNGLYAPHTHDGFVVVDDVVASCYTRALDPHAAHSLLTPIRAVMWMIGRTVDPVAGWLNQGSESRFGAGSMLSFVKALTSLVTTRYYR